MSEGGAFRKLVRSLSRSNKDNDRHHNKTPSPPLGSVPMPSTSIDRPERTSSRHNAKPSGGGARSPGFNNLSTSPAPDSYFPQPPAQTVHDSEANGRARHPDSRGARANDIGQVTHGMAAPGVAFAPSTTGASRLRPDSELAGWNPLPRRTQSQRAPRGTNNPDSNRHRAGSASQANAMPPPPPFSENNGGRQRDPSPLPQGDRKGVSLQDQPLTRSTSVKRVASAVKKAVFAPVAKQDGEKRVMILVADGSEEIEVMTIFDVLVRASLRPTIVSLSPQLSPSQSLPYITLSRGARMLADTKFETLKQEHKDDFDAIIIPGGAKGADRLSSSREVQTLIRSFYDQGKLVGMICAGSLAAKTSGIAGGQRITSHPSVKGDLEKHYDYVEDRVVVSGNLVTSRGPGTALEWALTIVNILAGSAKRSEVEGPLMM
ncbi:BQ5605_C001g00606 [Microbotryum silenes-dioicae]|uniref:D-lactate dehydratase n=1 Tax=Microbotryum silenes-dioicae TaxID=796604 RepID=A0A2X0P6J8_9BASI|nr:BQ5605_C001g00606 [Microbotryum silenes-dioicae]